MSLTMMMMMVVAVVVVMMMIENFQIENFPLYNI